VGFHGGLGDEQVLGDLAVGPAVGGEQFLAYLGGQGGGAGALGQVQGPEQRLARQCDGPAGEAPDSSELAAYCQARLAHYKTPVRWLFTDAFPLTSTGKVRTDVLSAQLAEAGKVPSSVTL
jgi:acyl-CoA synthetase (AMP-forming)/AMP-acid ligase II